MDPHNLHDVPVNVDDIPLPGGPAGAQHRQPQQEEPPFTLQELSNMIRMLMRAQQQAHVPHQVPPNGQQIPPPALPGGILNPQVQVEGQGYHFNMDNILAEQILHPIKQCPQPSVVIPQLGVGGFKAKGSMIQNVPKFNKKQGETAYSFLRDYTAVCTTLKEDGKLLDHV